MTLCPKHAHLSASHGGCATLHGDDGVSPEAVALSEVHRLNKSIGEWAGIAVRATIEDDRASARVALAHITELSRQIERTQP